MKMICNKIEILTVHFNIVLRLFTLPARAFFWGAWAGWGGGGGVPAAHNSKTIHGIETKFGTVVENHKLINLVYLIGK